MGVESQVVLLCSCGEYAEKHAKKHAKKCAYVCGTAAYVNRDMWNKGTNTSCVKKNKKQMFTITGRSMRLSLRKRPGKEQEDVLGGDDDNNNDEDHARCAGSHTLYILL